MTLRLGVNRLWTIAPDPLNAAIGFLGAALCIAVHRWSAVAGWWLFGTLTVAGVMYAQVLEKRLWPFAHVGPSIERDTSGTWELENLRDAAAGALIALLLELWLGPVFLLGVASVLGFACIFTGFGFHR